MSAVWTYEEYWRTVLGTLTAEGVAAEHELIADGLDEWLGTAEAEAWSAGGQGGDLPEEWGDFHGRALAELREAVAS